MTIVVTGGSGFLGRFVVEQLRSKYDNVISLNSKDYNLIDNSQVIKMYENCRPNIIIHLALHVFVPQYFCI